MSASTRLPAIFSTITLAGSAVALSVSPSLRSQVIPEQIRRAMPAHLKKHTLRVLAGLFVLVNLKNVPTTWHIRVLRAIIYQLYFSPKPIRRAQLFAPLVTHTWNSPLDCDYNFHKSNSTYFKDLDVARAHYVGALIRTGLRRLNAGDKEGLSTVAAPTQPKGRRKVPDNFIIALGGVSCTFRKEIKPLARFEIWTRLLSWDDKWFYVVSHVVRPGAIRPKGYHLQPWKEQGRSWLGSLFSSSGKSRKDRPIRQGEDLKRAVYATSIAKYVCKKGRATVPPEVLFDRSRLLPRSPKPASPPQDTTPLAGSEPDVLRLTNPDLLSADSASGQDTPLSSSLGGPEAAGPALASALRQTSEVESGEVEEELSWEQVEHMRLRGLKYATMFDGLAGLQDEFGSEARDGAEDVLGFYGDLFY